MLIQTLTSYQCYDDGKNSKRNAKCMGKSKKANNELLAGWHSSAGMLKKSIANKIGFLVFRVENFKIGNAIKFFYLIKEKYF